MRKVSHSALVPYSASQMYALVENIEAYPSFLPWCSSATVHERDSGCIEASLEMQRNGISKSFRTRNTLRPGVAMDIALVGGPFKHLDGGWRFEAMGDEGCKVRIELAFEFESRLIDTIFGRYFEDTCTSMIDSFTRRANEVYG